MVNSKYNDAIVFCLWARIFVVWRNHEIINMIAGVNAEN